MTSLEILVPPVEIPRRAVGSDHASQSPSEGYTWCDMYNKRDRACKHMICCEVRQVCAFLGAGYFGWVVVQHSTGDNNFNLVHTRAAIMHM
jgi:hypothetical protein